MSAKDRLDTYERDWERHEDWRKPGNTMHGPKEAGKYVEKTGHGLSSGPFVRFSDMPTELRERVAGRLESVVRQLVDEEHAALLAKLRSSAVEEAERTLKDLRGPQ